MGKAISVLGTILFILLEIICVFMSFIMLIASFSLTKTLMALGLWYVVVGLFICSILGIFNGFVTIGLFLTRKDD